MPVVNVHQAKTQLSRLLRRSRQAKRWSSPGGVSRWRGSSVARANGSPTS